MSSQKLPDTHRSVSILQHLLSFFLSFFLSSFAVQLFFFFFSPPDLLSDSLRLSVIDAWQRSQTEAVQTWLLCKLLLILFHLSHNEVLVSLGECQQCLARQQVRSLQTLDLITSSPCVFSFALSRISVVVVDGRQQEAATNNEMRSSPKLSIKSKSTCCTLLDSSVFSFCFYCEILDHLTSDRKYLANSS